MSEYDYTNIPNTTNPKDVLVQLTIPPGSIYTTNTLLVYDIYYSNIRSINSSQQTAVKVVDLVNSSSEPVKISSIQTTVAEPEPDPDNPDPDPDVPVRPTIVNLLDIEAIAGTR